MSSYALQMLFKHHVNGHIKNVKEMFSIDITLNPEERLEDCQILSEEFMNTND